MLICVLDNKEEEYEFRNIKILHEWFLDIYRVSIIDNYRFILWGKRDYTINKNNLKRVKIMDKIRKIKGLKSQLKDQQGVVEALEVKVKNIQREYSLKLNQCIDLDLLIKNLEKDETPKVSEHAIVRYFERVKGFNIKDISEEILNQEVLSIVDSLGGTGVYPNKQGYQVVMKNFTVTTIT